MILKGKTEVGIQTISIHGEQWDLIHKALEVSQLNNKPGFLLRSNQDNYFMWIEENSLDFDIQE